MMKNWFKRKVKDEPVDIDKIPLWIKEYYQSIDTLPTVEIPKGWLVYDLSQSPLHMLWQCQIIEFLSDKPEGERRMIYVEELDHPLEAIKSAVDAIDNKHENFIEESF